MAAQQPYPRVIEGLRGLAARNAGRAEAGWTFDDLKAAKSATPAETYTAPLVQGATLGFGDEIGAGIDAALGRGTYETNVARNRAVLARARGERSGFSAATEFVGGLVPGVATSGLATGATLASTALRSLGVGAAEGAAYGAGTGEGMDDRTSRAAFGGTVGAVVGGASPFVAEGVKGLARGAQVAFRPEAAAAGDLARAVAKDGMTPDELATRTAEAAALRPGAAAIADAGGPEVRRLLDRAAGPGAGGRKMAAAAMAARQQGQPGRLATDLKGLAGVDGTGAARREAASAPLYAEALAFDVAAAPSLAATVREVARTPAGRRALAEARKLAGAEGAPLPAGRDAPVTMQTVDHLARGLDRMLARRGAGADEGTAAVEGLRRRLLDEADAANPAYRQARDAWPGAARYGRAEREGRRIGSMAPDEARRFLADAGEAEREAFRAGAAGFLANRIGHVDPEVSDATTLLRSPAMREKMLMLMPDEAAREGWARRFEAELGFSRAARRPPASAAPPAPRGGLAADLVADLAGAAVTGIPGVGSVLSRVGREALGGVRAKARSRTDAALAGVLSTTDAARMVAALEGLRRAPPVGYGPTVPRVATAAAAPLTGGLLGMIPPSRPASPLPDFMVGMGQGR